jgi:hypothetical protein
MIHFWRGASGHIREPTGGAERCGAARSGGMDRSVRNVRRNVRDSRTGIWSARLRR